MPVPPCLSPFTPSVVRTYVDEYENDESRGVSLGLFRLRDYSAAGTSVSSFSSSVPTGTRSEKKEKR